MSKKPWVEGTVVKGEGRGRTIGFPTANVVLEDPAARPADGIYAVWARLLPDTLVRPAVMHAGPRPTFPGADVAVEIHLFDFGDRDLYGHRIAFQNVRRLRGIEKFATVEALAKAISNDCTHARHILLEQG